MRERAFTAGWLVAAAVLSSWAVSSAADRTAVRQPVSGQGATAVQAIVPALPPLSFGLDTEISRLALRSRALAAPAVPLRNLFEFAEPAGLRTRNRRTVPAAADIAPSAAPVDVLPEPAHAPEAAPSLAGIAHVAGMVTAVVSFGNALHYVKKGDVIAGRFRVDAVSDQEAELFDLRAGMILRLTLKTVT